MKPVKIAHQVFGGDASSGAEERLEPLMAAVDRLNMQITTDTLAGALVERLVTDAQSGSTRRVAGTAVGHQQDVLAQHRFEDCLQVGRRDRWQDCADGHAGAVDRNQDRHLLVRQAAFA